LKAFGVAVLVVVTIAAIAGIAFGIRWVTAGPKGALEAREQIKSGPSRIAAYNHFFDLCASVQSDEARLDAQRDELASATGDDVARIHANIAGLMSDRAEAINEYNADAEKGYTIGQFRASKLPFQLSTDAYTTNGDKTQCAA
jgi:TPR repeat protein